MLVLRYPQGISTEISFKDRMYIADEQMDVDYS